MNKKKKMSPKAHKILHPVATQEVNVRSMVLRISRVVKKEESSDSASVEIPPLPQV